MTECTKGRRRKRSTQITLGLLLFTSQQSWLKKKQGFTEKEFEELSRLPGALDSTNAIERALYSTRKLGDLLNKISNIDSDSFVMYLEDSKSKGRT